MCTIHIQFYYKIVKRLAFFTYPDFRQSRGEATRRLRRGSALGGRVVTHKRHTRRGQSVSAAKFEALKPSQDRMVHYGRFCNKVEQFWRRISLTVLV